MELDRSLAEENLYVRQKFYHKKIISLSIDNKTLLFLIFIAYT